jgi:hypothetical protein
MFNLEKEREQKVIKALEKEGAWVVKFWDPRRRGGPDRLVIGDRFDYLYFIEFKRPGGKLAKLQIEYAREMAKRLVEVFLIDSGEKAERFLNERFKLGTDMAQFRLTNAFPISLK